MRQTGRLRLIPDRFIAGHDNCDLRRHLDSVPPETPIRDVVDRCRVWESHADSMVRRMTKPKTDMTYPTYAVGDADKDREVIKVAAVTGLRSDLNQLKDLLWRIVSAVELEQLLRSVLDGQRRRERQPQKQRQTPKQRPVRRDWSEVICFSCGKTGHPGTRCPDNSDSLQFLQPGWQKEKTPGGFIMIPPWVAMDRKVE